MPKNKLPLFELRINEDKEAFVDAIAIVDQPAIESDFLAFSKDQMNISFAADNEKMELIGAAMCPDKYIYRKDAKTGEEFNVYFTSDTIRQIAQIYMKRGFQNAMNIDHTATPAGSFIYQSYIVDSAKGMTSPKGLNLPDGSWVVGVKVTSEDTWKAIKAGKLNGLSVEGLFQFFEPNQKMNSQVEDEPTPEKLLQLLKKLQSVLPKKN